VSPSEALPSAPGGNRAICTSMRSVWDTGEPDVIALGMCSEVEATSLFSL